MQLQGRSFSTGNYRFGFNGKEKDNDGNIVQYDYGFRIYDSRIARFKSVDPLTKSYPWYTPYQFAGNNPIGSVDIDGLEPSVTWNAVEDKKDVPDKTQEMKKQLEEAYKSGDDHDYVSNLLGGYKKAIKQINQQRTKNPLSANNLQFYLNGTGGTKVEDYNNLIKCNAFVQADIRLTSYYTSEASKAVENLKPGESKTFFSTGYAAQFEASMFYDDLYYASGTSFIKGSAMITVTKDKEGNTSFDMTIYKTWIDTYDWHPGLGVDYYATDISDEQMFELQSWGAKPFEMRAYYQTRYKAHLGSAWFGLIDEWKTDLRENTQTPKTQNHPDAQTTNGY